MSEIKVDTVAEKTSANGVTVDGLNIKDSKLVTANSVVTANITDANVTLAKLAGDSVDATKIADDAVSEEHLDVTAITGHGALTSVADGDHVLISDTSASAALKKITVANLVANAGGGKIGQVVSHTLTSVTSISAGSFVATGLTLNITPAASSSKIYLIASVSTGGESNKNQLLRFFRDSTVIGAAADSGAQNGATSHTGRTHTSTSVTTTITFLDAPSSTSQITYSIKLFGQAGITHYINRTEEDENNDHKGRTTSTLTAFEVLA